MSPKIANLIAIETGILVGLMSWLTYSRFPSTEPRTSAEMRGGSVAPVTTVAPAFEASNQRPSTIDYSAEREQARLMAERSVSLASLQRYYQAIATEAYTSSGLDNGSIAADTPSYPAAEQPAEYLAPPQTIIYYAEPDQGVSFSNGRSFRNRRRSTLHSGELVSVIPRLPDGQVVPRLPDSQVVPRLPDTSVVPRLPGRAGFHPSVPFCRPTQGFGSRWNR